MAFGSLTFIAFALVSIVLLRTLPPSPAKSAVLLFINLVFLASFVDTALGALPLIAFLLLGYVTICTAPRLPGKTGTFALIAGFILVFIWLKHYTIVSKLPGVPFPYAVVGLSFILFRILHLVVDVGEGSMQRPSLLSYLNYTLFFLTFASGPIQRYDDFSASQKSTKPITPAAMNADVRRTARGFFLLYVPSPIFLSITTGFQLRLYNDLSVFPQFPRLTIADFAAAALFYLIYLYVNFAGYMDIVIGVGRLAGHELPENFDAPWRSKNFLDLWARWHITLSEWFKLYLFTPLAKALGERWGGTVPMSRLGTIAFFVTFGVMGIWHGTTLIYVVYGALLGAGVTVNRVWQAEGARRWGKKSYKALCQKRWYQAAARGTTLAFFALSLTCIWVDAARITSLPAIVLFAYGTAAWLLLTGLLFIADMLIVGAADRLAYGRGATAHERKARWVGSPAMTAILVFALTIMVMAGRGPAEVLVYKGF
jgi:alginate O-acetyltransferase complex protein AlgI